MRWCRLLIAAGLLAAAFPALAQNQGNGVQQSGAVTPGHSAAWRANGVIGDAGGSSAPTQANQGAIFGGLNVLGGACTEDGYNNLTLSPSGYHQLCLFPNSLGGGLISYNAYNGASPLSLNFNINGSTYPFPSPGGGNVLGPNSTTINHLALWNNTIGTLLRDSPTLPINLSIALPSTTFVPSDSSAISSVISASGTMTVSNTIALPSGQAWPINYDNCSDTATAPSATINNPLILNCRQIYMSNIGTGTGDRDGIGIDMLINGTATQIEGAAFYNGGIATIHASSNLGGITSGEIGDVYGWSTQIALLSGATHYASVHGAGEWDLEVAAGASVANKMGAQIALITGDAVQGSNIDAALLFTNNGSSSWKNLIELGLPIGQGGSFPISSSGTIMGSYQGGSAAQGINFTNITFSGCGFQTLNVCVGNSAIAVGSTNLIGGSTLTVHTATNDNLGVFDGSSGNLSTGILIESINDAGGASRNLEIHGAAIRFTADTGVNINGTAAVSCPSGVTAGTVVVVDGIVTHC